MVLRAQCEGIFERSSNCVASRYTSAQSIRKRDRKKNECQKGLRATMPDLQGELSATAQQATNGERVVDSLVFVSCEGVCCVELEIIHLPAER